MQCAAAMMAKVRDLAGTAGALALAWMAAHAALLALLALGWGLLVAGKVVLGWLAQTLVFAFLLVAGIGLVFGMWGLGRPRRRLPRPA